MNREKKQNPIKRKAPLQRSLLAGMALLATLWTAGCGEEIPDLNDEQFGLAGEYAANLLLKYDANHRQRLMSLEEMEKEEQRRAAWEVPTPPPDEKNPQEDGNPSYGGESSGNQEPVRYGKLEDFFVLPDGVTIQYAGYAVRDSYPEDQGGFYLGASDGKELLIVKFLLQNNSDAAQSVDLFDRKASYRITLNGNISKTPLVTLLDNDLVTYQETIAAGAAEEVVLLVEIDRNMEVNSMTLRLKNESIESTILLE